MAGRMTTMGMIAGFVLICLLIGCGGSDGGSTDSTIDPYSIEPSSIESFELEGGDICREDGKPVIRLFSNTGCSHCNWVADAFDPVVKMYVEEGLIVAHHWEMDTGDDTLTTDQVEDGVPVSEMEIYDDFMTAYDGDYVPAFVFGCKYYRLGTEYEQSGGLEAEAAEFMAVIEELLNEDLTQP